LVGPPSQFSASASTALQKIRRCRKPTFSTISANKGPVAFATPYRRIDSMVAQGDAAMSDLMLLSEAQMRRIEPYFPLSHGIPRVDDRRIISGIISSSCLGSLATIVTCATGPEVRLFRTPDELQRERLRRIVIRWYLDAEVLKVDIDLACHLGRFLRCQAVGRVRRKGFLPGSDRPQRQHPSRPVLTAGFWDTQQRPRIPIGWSGRARPRGWG
jgi:hypothetical protein